MKLNVLLLGVSVAAVLASPVNLNSREDGVSLAKKVAYTDIGQTYEDELKAGGEGISDPVVEPHFLDKRPEMDGGKVRAREEGISRPAVHSNPPDERPAIYGGKVRAREDGISRPVVHSNPPVIHPIVIAGGGDE